MERFVADAVLTCDESMTVYRPGAIDVDDSGRIAWVGPAGDSPAAHRLSGLLMPGLVNAHCHSPMVLLRGLGEGLPLHRWLTEHMWPREARLTPDTVYSGMLLASSEMLRLGVTTSTEMYFHPESIAQAVLDSGARCLVAGAVADIPLPWLGEWPAQLDAAGRLHDRYCDPTQRVTAGIAAHSAYATNAKALSAMADFARERGVLAQIHLAESEHEGDEISGAHGGASVPRILADLGFFTDTSVLAAHCVWLSDADIALLADFDVRVAHCPGSNAKLASGIAPLAELLAAGIPVALGTDGPASGDDLDVWEEIRLAALLARLRAGDAAALPAAEALALATRGGGAALGLSVGQLRPGYWADFLRLDTGDSGFVPGDSDADLIAHLVWSVPRSAIRDVWVGGEQVVAGGGCTRVDVAVAAERARRAAAQIS